MTRGQVEPSQLHVSARTLWPERPPNSTTWPRCAGGVLAGDQPIGRARATSGSIIRALRTPTQRGTDG
jgi:hypothetical protein